MLWLASVFLRPIARKEIVADEERAVNGSAPLPFLNARGRTLLAVCNRGCNSSEPFFVAYTRSCIAHICGIHSAISFPFNLSKRKGPTRGARSLTHLTLA
jgi:hypothetical protein